MKVIVIGGVAGGASAAARIRRLNSYADIIMFDRGEHVSFSNCALPYYIGGDIEDSEKLIMMSPEKFKARHNIDVRVKSEVIEINRAEKCVVVRELETGREYTESYDKLILSPGANAIKPKSIAGVDKPHVFTVRNVTDIRALKAHADAINAQNIAVAGGGFIGIEIVENFVKAGKKVSLIEGASQIMMPFDNDMAQILQKELIDNGVDVYLNSMVSEIHDNTLIAKCGEEAITIAADIVVLSIGVAKETTLAVKAGLEIGETRGIKVNHNYQTNDPDIYAVGDAIEYYDRMNRKYGALALAGPAQRQARAAADHICGMYHNYKGYIGSSCLRVFELNAACVGMNERAAAKANIPYEIAYIIPHDIVKLMPGAEPMSFKLVFEVPTGRILGAQAIGQGNATKHIDVIAAMITMGADLEDLKELELCYAPLFGTAKDVVNMAALVGLNLLYNRIRQVKVYEVRELVEQGAYFIDIREPEDFVKSHVKNAVNIPLSQFKDRINEVPKDKPVYLYCRTGQRSYYALCELLGNGYTNAVNVSGSFLGICLHEYFADKTYGREPIVTGYNFE